MDTTGPASDALTSELIGLEAALLVPAIRRDPRAVSALLHPDFFEFGRSGERWTRDDVLIALSGERSSAIEMTEPRAVELAEGVALLTYHSTSPDGRSALRSSVWVKHGDAWTMRFHQGTPRV